uniref:PAS domain-containing protein n=1 Tax=Rhizobium populisoli TaxID=2859785 RepID=UPI001FEAE003
MASFLSSAATTVLDALDLSFAVIEFDLDGNILKANKNFCDLMGYSETELRGKHHRMFLDSEYDVSQDYAAFWSKLRRGEFLCSEFTRLAKGGAEIFIRGNYNPIKNRSGKVLKIVKFANDITQTKMHGIDTGAKIEAISRAQAMIEFKTDGTVLSANENFLNALG